MAKATDLISLVVFCPKTCFLPTVIAPMLASWFYQSYFSVPFSTTALVVICDTCIIALVQDLVSVGAYMDLQWIGIIVTKARVVTYTCRYSSGHVFFLVHPDMTKIGIKLPVTFVLYPSMLVPFAFTVVNVKYRGLEQAERILPNTLDWAFYELNFIILHKDHRSGIV